jgi:hypothetical protein
MSNDNNLYRLLIVVDLIDDTIITDPDSIKVLLSCELDAASRSRRFGERSRSLTRT